MDANQTFGLISIQAAANMGQAAEETHKSPVSNHSDITLLSGRELVRTTRAVKSDEAHKTPLNFHRRLILILFSSLKIFVIPTLFSYKDFDLEAFNQNHVHGNYPALFSQLRTSSQMTQKTGGSINKSQKYG